MSRFPFALVIVGLIGALATGCGDEKTDEAKQDATSGQADGVPGADTGKSTGDGASSGSVDRFVMSFGGKETDEGQAIAVMADNTIAVAGYTNSAGTGDWDGWLVSMTRCGKVRWARTYGGAKKDEFTSMAIAADGGIAMFGTTGSFKGSNESWLVKTDADGKLEWSRTYGGSGYDAGLTITALPDGFVLLADTYNFGPGTPDNHNLMIVRTDAKGHMKWERTFGGPPEGDAGFAVLHLPDTTTTTAVLMVGGATESYSHGKDDLWLTKMHDGGDVLWSKAYGGPGDDELRGLAQAKDGGFITTGFTRGFAAAKSDVFLMKVDGQGKLQWAHTYGGPERDRGYAVFEVDGGYVVAGHAAAIGIGAEDGFLMKTGPTGKLVWWHALGGKAHEEILSAARFGDGFVVTGRSESFAHDKGRQLFVMRTDKNGDPGCGIKVMGPGEVKNFPAKPSVKDVKADTATGVTEKSPKIVTGVVTVDSTWTKTPCSSGICE